METTAKILRSYSEDGKNIIVLDRTVFYPEGGGQNSDVGTIDNSTVSYVFEKDGEIHHVVDKFPTNDEVRCRVDFEKRFDHMQSHTGEHLLAAVFNRLYHTESQGFHMGEEYVNIDITLPEISDMEVSKVENIVNEYINQNIAVESFIVNEEESRKLALRKRVSKEEGIRIVKIGEADACACCGTHVNRTGEIGLVKIIKTEKYKGMTRIYFKCGKRALKDYQQKHSDVMELVRFLSANEKDIVVKVKKLEEDLKTALKSITELKKQQAAFEAENLIKGKKDNIINKIYDNKDSEEIQFIIDKLMQEKVFIILGSRLNKQIFIINNSDINIELSSIFKNKLKEYNGKGGGSNKRVQAVFNEQQDAEKFINLEIYPNLKVAF